MNTGITITSATHVGGYKIKIAFSDGKVNVFDYKNLVMSGHEESEPYKDIENFKKFDIINNSEIAWGDNWAMILPLATIYNKTTTSLSH